MTIQLQRPYLASYCMIRANDAILVQRRFNTGYLDSHWALPSGHVQEGEEALAAASRELLEETSLIVKPEDWQFVCAMHRRTDRTIIDLFFTTANFTGAPRICEPTKCDGLAFFPINALPPTLCRLCGRGNRLPQRHQPTPRLFLQRGVAVRLLPYQYILLADDAGC